MSKKAHCDQCGKTQDIDEDKVLGTNPAGWISLTEQRPSSGRNLYVDFCSWSCVMEYARTQQELA